MNTNKISTPDELSARHASIAERLWQEIKQRFADNSDTENLYRWLTTLTDAPADADLAAWNPEKLNNVHYSAQTGLVVNNGDPEALIEKTAVDIELREGLAAISDGISRQEIIEEMLAACKQDYPELFERLQAFFAE